MKPNLPEQYRIIANKKNAHLQEYFSEPNESGGWFFIPVKNATDVLRIHATNCAGWDHVSVSLRSGCLPNWNSMCMAKALFFTDEECVVQYHPPKKNYVNLHPGCLHLWRPQNDVLPCPPPELVA